MGTFRQFDFRTYYSKADQDTDIADDFFIPCMSNAVAYDRITGFFGSSIYIIIWGALKRFVGNQGKMRILCSPRISSEDREAINFGLESKGSELLVRSLKAEIDDMFLREDIQKPARVLSCLIATGIVDIRIVTTDYDDIPLRYHTMFHDKIGIFTDSEGDRIAFGGSMNETYQGLSSTGNSETVTVHISWDPGRDGQRTREFSDLFEEIWSNRAANITVHDLPSDIRRIFEEYSGELNIEDLIDSITPVIHSEPLRVGRFELMPYQSEAFRAWVDNGRRGMLEHATGSGKTVTGMYCIQDSLRRGEVPVLIVPSLDLQNQWISNIKAEIPNIEILVCGGQDTRSWKKTIPTWSRKGNGRRMIVAVVNTASSETFLKGLSQGSHLFLMADEVHRLGSNQFRKVLEVDSGARLGLSATPRRFRDEEGTEAIFGYFGPIVHRFTLIDAIRAHRLTEYYYHPVITHLSPEEEEEWEKLSREISKAVSMTKEADPFKDDRVKRLVIQRSRIAKNAASKVEEAVRVIQSAYRRGQRWLVYCDNIEQMNALWTRLYALGFDVSKYYSSMAGDRETTLGYIAAYGGILVSIKCLDEGVDIPSVSHALIIASSQNPREHIQRRGRVLRLAEGKISAHVYDLIIVPETHTDDGHFASLIEGELARAIGFGENAINSDSCVADLRVLALELGIEPDSVSDEGYEEEDS